MQELHNVDSEAIQIIAEQANLEYEEDGKHNTFSKVCKVSSMDFDAAGSLVFTDWDSHTIRQLSIGTKKVTTLSGRPAEWGFRDGKHDKSICRHPRGICTDAYGNVFFTDSFNHRVRMISKDGYTTTVAGSVKGYEEGYGRDARFNFPRAITLDPDGHLIVVDAWNNAIRRIKRNGYVETLSEVNGQPHDVCVNPKTNEIFVLHETRDERFYVLSKYNEQRGMLVIVKDNMSRKESSAGCCIADPSGNILISSDSRDIYHINPLSSKVKTYRCDGLSLRAMAWHKGQLFAFDSKTSDVVKIDVHLVNEESNVTQNRPSNGPLVPQDRRTNMLYEQEYIKLKSFLGGISVPLNKYEAGTFTMKEEDTLHKNNSHNLFTGTANTQSPGVEKGSEVAIKRYTYTETADVERVLSIHKAYSLRLHPNILHAHGYFLLKNQLHIVMPCCRRGSLSSVLTKLNIKVPLDIKKKILRDVASGLEFLHSLNTWHGSLTSDKILVDNEFSARLAPPTTGKVSNPLYAPSEVSLGAKKPSSKTDMFSFGILVWEVMSQKAPGTVLDLAGTGNSRPSPIPNDCPKELEMVMKLCWHEDPDKRLVAKYVLTKLV